MEGNQPEDWVTWKIKQLRQDMNDPRKN